MLEKKRFGVIENFVNLRTTFNKNGTLDAEIDQRIAKNNTAFFGQIVVLQKIQSSICVRLVS